MRTLAVLTAAIVLAGCNSDHAKSTTPTTAPGRVCVSGHGAPLPAFVTFAVLDHTGNEWVVPAPATVHVRITQAPDSRVLHGEIQITPAAGSSDDVVRHLAIADAWKPGERTGPVYWDGKGDDGDRVKPGRYRLQSSVEVSGWNRVACRDGGGQGFELSNSTEGAGLGLFEVD